MLIQLFTYIPTIIISVFLIVFVYLKNPKDSKNQAFSLLMLAIILWLLSLFVADTTSSELVVEYGIKSALLFTTFIPLALLNFALKFPFEYQLTNRNKRLLFLPPLALGILSLTNLMVQEVTVTDAGAVISSSGIAYGALLLYLVVYSIAAFAILVRKIRDSNRVQELQIKLIVSSGIFAILLNIAANFAFTSFNLEEYAVFVNGPSLLIVAVSISYAIIKHRMFDIRLVVARSVAYTLLLGTLGLVYGAALFGLSNYLLKNQAFSLSQVIINTLLALALVVSFQPLKRYFDKITNRVFYRDAYDSQKVLNSLSELLASEMKLVRIARKSLALVTDNLHLYYGLFIIIGDEGGVYQTERHGRAPERTPSVNMLGRLDENLTLADELNGDEQKEILDQFDAAAALRLKTKEGIVGYILLGRKESGNIYTQQDVKFLRIVANELSIAVENARNFEQIQAFNETLQQKVDDATKKLRRTNKKLRQLDEAKDEFITMASHQLRTPLTTIKGYVSMMLEGDAGKITKKQKEMLKAAYTSSDRMVYLIADLLNVSRLSTGKFVIQPKRVNIIEVIRSEIDQLERHFEAKNIEAEFNAPDHMPSVELDENKIRQVIMNYIDNAIYYTPEDGKITITLEEKDEAIELRVKDNGIGVPKQEQHKLFTKFFRATNAKKARPDGTGLGLYLAKKVVSAQGGTVIFESEEGKGSTFGFSFPKDRILVSSSEEKEPSESEKAKATA